MKKLKVCSYIAVLLLIVSIKVMFVSGSSMEPTIHDKSIHFGVNKYIGRLILKKGDIIAIKPPKNELTNDATLIKRVIGMPNDHIVIENGVVSVNGEQLDEDYIKEPETNDNLDLNVPDGCVFCMGDNRTDSLDSRFKLIGFLNIKDCLKGVYLY